MNSAAPIGHDRLGDLNRYLGRRDQECRPRAPAAPPSRSRPGRRRNRSTQTSPKATSGISRQVRGGQRQRPSNPMCRASGLPDSCTVIGQPGQQNARRLRRTRQTRLPSCRRHHGKTTTITTMAVSETTRMIRMLKTANVSNRHRRSLFRSRYAPWRRIHHVTSLSLQDQAGPADKGPLQRKRSGRADLTSPRCRASPRNHPSQGC